MLFTTGNTLKFFLCCYRVDCTPSDYNWCIQVFKPFKMH